jgi:hypothetical protein
MIEGPVSEWLLPLGVGALLYVGLLIAIPQARRSFWMALATTVATLLIVILPLITIGAALVGPIRADDLAVGLLIYGAEGAFILGVWGLFLLSNAIPRP